MMNPINLLIALTIMIGIASIALILRNAIKWAIDKFLRFIGIRY